MLVAEKYHFLLVFVNIMAEFSNNQVNYEDGSLLGEETSPLAEGIDEEDGFQIVGRRERKIKPKLMNPVSSKPKPSGNKPNVQTKYSNSKIPVSGAYAKPKGGMNSSSASSSASDSHQHYHPPSKPSQAKASSSGPVESRTVTRVPVATSSAKLPSALPVRIESLSLEPKPMLTMEAFAVIMQSLDDSFTTSSLGYISSRGFENSGNACYRNAVFQVLFANHHFNRFDDLFLTFYCADFLCMYRYLKELCHMVLSSYELPAELGLFKELVQFIQILDNPSSSQIQSQRPRPIHPDRFFVSSIAEFTSLRQAQGSSMASMLTASGAPSQEDAMEFFTFMLDRYHDILSRHVPSSSIDSSPKDAVSKEEDEWLTAGKGVNMSRVVVNLQSKQEAVKAHQASIISRLFHGILRSEVIYAHRKTSSTTYQLFHAIPLELSIPTSSSSAAKHSSTSMSKYRHTLLSSLDRFFSSEVS
jgi:ubiquitin C-terminal hydrolase